jgi:hypothetical protein
MKLNSKKNVLIKQVHDAFLNVPMPSLEGSVKISYSYDVERKDLDNFLRGKHWSEVTFETITADYHHQAAAILFFLTEDGFHYYFPAFLLISLNLESAELDDQLVESAFVPFSRLYSDEDSRFYRARVDRFSMQQLQATEAVFKHILEERQQKTADEVGVADKRLNSIDVENFENAISGIHRAILDRG